MGIKLNEGVCTRAALDERRANDSLAAEIEVNAESESEERTRTADHRETAHVARACMVHSYHNAMCLSSRNQAPMIGFKVMAI